MWRSSRSINNRSKRNRRIGKNNIDIEIAQVRILESHLIFLESDRDNIKVKRLWSTSLITGMLPFVSGLGVDKTKAKIEVLEK